MVEDAGVEIRFLGQPLVGSAGQPLNLARRETTLTMLALVILRRDRPGHRRGERVAHATGRGLRTPAERQSGTLQARIIAETNSCFSCRK
jgi:hypothetical protein